MKINIVIIAFDKVKPLKRLLTSLTALEIPSSTSVDLSFCIDGAGAKEIAKYAKEYQWFGNNKFVSTSDSHLGLKANVYRGMKLGLAYDAVIILEDDLYVSPYLLYHAKTYIDFYSEDNKISSISLYSSAFNETAYCNFLPIDDDYDVFFMKVPSSWGQIYTKKHLKDYFKWHQSILKFDFSNLPPNVNRWSNKSWKKEFFTYLIENNKYVVYPRKSLTTNYADKGEHHSGSNIYQVPLCLSKQSVKLVSFDSSNSVYDEYYEIEVNSLKAHNKILNDYNFTVNLYGFKKTNINKYSTDYTLSTLKLKNPVISWDDAQIPLEMNCINNTSGDGIYLYKTADMHSSKLNLIKSRLKTYSKLHNIRIDLSFISRMFGRS